ncbi:MAG: hypothetical protein CL758_07345 [Chloroflexi bacterium]|nr:hypothetical protein [Chloroflexota bacterium]|tara:strand:+ start:221 stop:1054 length:834 start_codon:yes stop_codon:yes gene_type:complete
MEILPNIYQIKIGGQDIPGLYAPNVFFVVGNDSAVFIDTAYGKKNEINSYLRLWEEKLRPKLSAIILTHRHNDHIGGAIQLNKATDGTLICGDKEVSHITKSFNNIIKPIGTKNGDKFNLGGITLEIIETPGHTSGSICIFLHEQKVLFAGDTVLGGTTTAISPEQGNMSHYIDSLNKLINYKAKYICPGHGELINNPQEKLENIINQREKRENQILNILKDGDFSPEEMFSKLYKRLNKKLHREAIGQIKSHLIKLKNESKIKVNNKGYYSIERKL